MAAGTFGSNTVRGICRARARARRNRAIQRDFLHGCSTNGRIRHTHGAGSSAQGCAADGVPLGGDERGWRCSNRGSADDHAQSSARALDSGQLIRCADPIGCGPATGRDFWIVLLHPCAKGVVGRSRGGAEIRIEKNRKWKSEIGRRGAAMSWLNRRFGKRKREEELGEEVRSHLQMASQDRVERGQAAVEAERAARNEFGNVELVKEVTRDVWGWGSLERLMQDLRFGLRMMAKSPGFTVVAVLTLALGIGANTAMFSVAYGILLRPLPYRDADRVAVVYMSYFPRDFKFGTMCIRDYLMWKENNHAFEEPSLFMSQRMDIGGEEGVPEQVQGASVTVGFFSTLGVHPLVGRPFAAGEDQPATGSLAVLSESIWRERFASSSTVLGQTILVNSTPTTVIGVMPDAFRFPGQQTEVWTNLMLARATLREREMALRISLGAGRSRLVRQLLTESLLMALLGGAAGLALAWGGIALVRAWNPGNLPFIDLVRLDLRALGFMFVVSMLTGVLSGLAPALESARADLNSTIKEGGRTGSASQTRGRARAALVVSEIAVSLMLLVGAGLLLRSFVNLQGVTGGFSTPPRQILTMLISPSNRKYGYAPAGLAFYDELLRRARAVPGVEAAAVTDSLPPDRQGDADSFGIEGQILAPGEGNPIISTVTVGPDFFQALGIPLVKGRYFTDHDNRR